jgi:hypothetical protein
MLLPGYKLSPQRSMLLAIQTAVDDAHHLFEIE